MTNFKTFAWGWNGSCAENGPSFVDDAYAALALTLASERWSGGLDRLTKRQLRATRPIVVNTFLEWGPTEASFPAQMGFGVDEITIEAATNETFRAGGDPVDTANP